MLVSLKEVLGMAPPIDIQESVRGKLLETLKGVNTAHIELRLSKRGRLTYLLVHVVVNDDFKIKNIDELDKIRKGSETTLQLWNPDIIMDMIFVKDPNLAV